MERERIFCDTVRVKVPHQVVSKFAMSKRDEYYEAYFKISKTTTFEKLREMCCKYWGLENN